MIAAKRLGGNIGKKAPTFKTRASGQCDISFFTRDAPETVCC